MHRELFETPERLREQLAANAPHADDITRTLNETTPTQWFVVGRGTSDHAGSFFRYASGLLRGCIVGDLSPSLMTVYDRSPSFIDGFLIAISQSGAGSDINHVVSEFTAGGGLTLALTNDADSALAHAAKFTLPLHMGPETAVAATKTFLGTLTALLQLLAISNSDDKLTQCLSALPDRLSQAAGEGQARIDTQALSRFSSPLFVIGRGLGLPIAREVALKFKEVCVMHAEAYSAAEFKHGPLALVGSACPILILSLDDETRPQTLDLAREADALGAPVVVVGPDLPAPPDDTNVSYRSLPITGSIYTDAVMASFLLYDVIERLALDRGIDPDEPPHIQKVTSTY